MKYFIGIVPKKEISEKIISFQKSFKNNKLPYIFEPHITIKSKNGLTEDLVWLDKVKNIIENFPKFSISFAERVVIIKPTLSKELVTLHKALYFAIKPDENDIEKKYFENDKFQAHITLGMTSWGMTKEELSLMKERGLIELSNLPKFTVIFIRIYQQANIDDIYDKFIDIQLNEK